MAPRPGAWSALDNAAFRQLRRDGVARVAALVRTARECERVILARRLRWIGDAIANVNGLLSGEPKGAQATGIALAWGGIALLVLVIIVALRAAYRSRAEKQNLKTFRFQNISRLESIS